MNQHPTCADLIRAAERELAAFLCAVRESYGPEQAVFSAEDWLAEFESLDCSSEVGAEWRRITIAAAAQLADRVESYVQQRGGNIRCMQY